MTACFNRKLILVDKEKSTRYAIDKNTFIMMIRGFI